MQLLNFEDDGILHFFYLATGLDERESHQKNVDCNREEMDRKNYYFSLWQQWRSDVKKRIPLLPPVVQHSALVVPEVTPAVCFPWSAAVQTLAAQANELLGLVGCCALLLGSAVQLCVGVLFHAARWLH